jgi:Leucine-rich repeat (LRR) protein
MCFKLRCAKAWECLTFYIQQIISSLKNLRHLTLAHNLINETQESAFANLPQLESLSLAHNRVGLTVIIFF